MGRTYYNDRRVAPGQRTVDLSKARDAGQEEIITSHHDLPTTQETIKQLLANGTPNWVKWPEDYKAFVKESFAAEKEISDEMAEQYHIEDQEDLTNELARKVNPMSTDAFVAKLRANGIKCFTVYNGLAGTVGLWCLPPKQVAKARYVCYMQIPAMYEWSVLRLDRHNIPVGEKFRGWRTVLMELIKKEILTEYQAHKIFGHPSGNKVFNRYRRSLWELRNDKRFTEEQIAERDV
jgi:hypothetical protein